MFPMLVLWLGSPWRLMLPHCINLNMLVSCLDVGMLKKFPHWLKECLDEKLYDLFYEVEKIVWLGAMVKVNHLFQ